MDTSDIEKLQRAISSSVIEQASESPKAKPVEGAFLAGLMQTDFDLKDCPGSTVKVEGANTYKVIAVTETVPHDPSLQSQKIVVVAKYTDAQHAFLMGTLSSAIYQQKDTLGKVRLSGSQGTGKQIVHYVSEGTVINVNTTVRAAPGLAVDVSKNRTEAQGPVDATMQVDFVNRLDVQQNIAEGTTIKGSVESAQSTGTRSIAALTGINFQSQTVRAEARVDSQVKGNVKTYAGVNYVQNETTSELNRTAGLDITVPNNATILVFTGFTERSLENDRNRYHGRQFGLEYKNKKGVKFFGKVRESNDGTGRIIESGLTVPLSK